MSSSDRSCSGTSGISGSCCSAIVFWNQRCNDFVDLLHLYLWLMALDKKRHEIGILDIFQCVTELNRA